MAYLLSGERPAVAAVSSNPLAVLARWFVKGRAARTQKLALNNLLELDEHRLEDLGINRQDLFDALNHAPQPTTRTLSARRASSARNWLNP